MATRNSGSFRIDADYREFSTNAAAGNAAASVPHRVSFEDTAAYDVLYSARLSLTTTPTDLALDALPSPLNVSDGVCATVHGIVVKHVSGAGNALVGSDGTAPADLLTGTDDRSIPVQPGGALALHYGTAGRTVANASTDVLQLAASAGTVVVDVVIFGNAA